MSCLTTGGSIRNTVRIRHENSWGVERKEEMPAHNMGQPPRSSCTRILAERCTRHQEGPESNQIWHKQDDWQETTRKANPMTLKPETASHVAEQFSWVPLPCCSLSGPPFPIKSFALSAHVSPRTIHYRGLDKSKLSGPERGPVPVTIVSLWIGRDQSQTR